ncbi:unnamed protein product [Phytophthora fragariaefolia]|uniref:Unnamed protein product n=1 Tax=Phytophthora fragariaefolia TaxID=1490495 RepID=A0A9W7D3J4_9STRA|nr:unnamed protein product [Phytophthora fragariaefolia]
MRRSAFSARALLGTLVHDTLGVHHLRHSTVQHVDRFGPVLAPEALMLPSRGGFMTRQRSARREVRSTQGLPPPIDPWFMALQPRHTKDEIISRIQSKTKQRSTLSKSRNFTPKSTWP